MLNHETPPKTDRKPLFNKKFKKESASWLLQILLFIVIAWGIQKYQTRNLIPEKEKAPSFSLLSLDREKFSLESFRGKPVMLYFFAPWCGVCKVSNGRVEEFYQNHKEEGYITLGVALSYQSAEEIRRYRNKHDISFPVLLGNNQVLQDYNISGFPVIYFINSEGLVHRHTMGFTTETGLSLRANW